jgi:2-methylcitrate dehydratase PrpD
MLTGLGEAWVSDTIAVKPYPGCAYVDTTLDALFRVLAEFRDKKARDLAPAEVSKIHVEANLLTVEMDNLSSEHVAPNEPLSPINVNFSVPFNVGIAIAAGAHEGRTLAQSFLDRHDAEIRELASKTKLVHDWKMSFDVARAFEGVLGRSGVLQHLGPRDYLALMSGYRRQLGGRKKTGLGFSALWKRRLGLGELTRAARQRPSSSSRVRRDLSSVDFTRFKMTFPVRVTLETADRERFSARQDIPSGAPGAAGQRETVRAKLLRELPHRLPSDRVASFANGIDRFERASLTELSALFGV